MTAKNSEPFDFWQDHSLKFLEMAFRTDRQERLAHPDGHGQKTGDCGDSVAFYIAVEGDRLAAISYQTDGCMHTNACANAVIVLLEGGRLADGWELTPEKVAIFLETLPADHFHCAELAVGALYLALADVSRQKRKPWKKAYLKSP